MNEQDKKLVTSLENLKKAFFEVLSNCNNDEEVFNDNYPFDRDFLELTHDVMNWVESEVEDRNEVGARQLKLST